MWSAPVPTDNFTEWFKTLCRKAAEVTWDAGLNLGAVAYPALTDLKMTSLGRLHIAGNWGWKKLQEIAEDGIMNPGGGLDTWDCFPDPRIGIGGIPRLWVRGDVSGFEGADYTVGLPIHNIKTIRAGLTTTLYYSGATHDSTYDGLFWCRTCYRRITSTAATSDVEGN